MEQPDTVNTEGPYVVYNKSTGEHLTHATLRQGEPVWSVILAPLRFASSDEASELLRKLYGGDGWRRIIRIAKK